MITVELQRLSKEKYDLITTAVIRLQKTKIKPPIITVTTSTSLETANVFKLYKGANIPAYIGDTRVMLNIDYVDSDIPLLLSKSTMKKANMQFYFEHEKSTVFSKKIALMTKSSGHYAIPIKKLKQIINDFNRGSF